MKLRCSLWLPNTSVLDCLTRPREVVAAVRAYCDRIEQRIADQAQHEYVLQQANAKLRKELDVVENENKRLRASHGAWSLRAHNGGVS